MSILFALISASHFSFADEAKLSGPNEKSLMVEALHRAALALPQDKRARAERVIADFEQGFEPCESDYGWSKAEPILIQGGVEALIQAARQTRGPLRYARTDALLSAGIRLRDSDPDGASQINATLLDLSEQAEAFEQAIYTHAAAELAAIRCDQATLKAATAKLGGTAGLRYAFWLARFEGNVPDLITRVWEEANSEDTSHIRQAIDGYRLIDQYGYCPIATASVAD